jgi:hypothetical protein
LLSENCNEPTCMQANGCNRLQMYWHLRLTAAAQCAAAC